MAEAIAVASRAASVMPSMRAEETSFLSRPGSKSGSRATAPRPGGTGERRGDSSVPPPMLRSSPPERPPGPTPAPMTRVPVAPHSYSSGEEIAHGVTHGLGAGLAVVGLAVLVVVA